MSRFGGNTSHPMDGKGRVSLPSKYRRELPDDLVVVRSPDRQFPSLWVYSDEAFSEWVDELFESRGGFKANSASDNALKRRLYGSREAVTVDQAGRILVPLALRQYASLGKSVVMVGVDNHIEIWDADVLARSDEAYDGVEVFDLP
ncbi:MAG: division/cell wall cluster transcriptional repressor MraZ [Coriobacteriales bacterium]|jgi:MraZ protein|nr:division/cell wall cluster transcriptional repressor MraZ [Coriobacteriales bacterium]